MERMKNDVLVSKARGIALAVVTLTAGFAGRALADSTAPTGPIDDARIVSVTRRRFEKAVRVPTELAGDMARAASVAQEAWVAAFVLAERGYCQALCLVLLREATSSRIVRTFSIAARVCTSMS